MVEPVTRTPEGEPNRCPVCGKELRLEPSRPPGDAPCPHCGSLLWFPSPALSGTGMLDLARQFFRVCAKSSLERFFPLPKLMGTLLQMLDARAATIWSVSEGGAKIRHRFLPKDRVLPERQSDQQRQRLLMDRVLASRQSSISPPRQFENDEGGELRDYLLLAVPVKDGGNVKAVIEVICRPVESVPDQQHLLELLECFSEEVSPRICQSIRPWWKVWQK
jgi:hypothetical protein